jgi:hypothetical protein
MSARDHRLATAQRKHIIGAMQAEVLRVNIRNGWFETERTVGDDLALLHSEVSEALDAYRAHGFDDITGEALPTPLGDTTIPKPEGFGSELADVLIRLLDTCERRGVDLVAEYERKIIYNATRSHRHGEKRL